MKNLRLASPTQEFILQDEVTSTNYIWLIIFLTMDNDGPSSRQKSYTPNNIINMEHRQTLTYNDVV